MAPLLSVVLPQGTGRVLSIQSHTVQGYVGNKAAVFPLQLLGFDVDPINSVQFSNHTGYPTVRGQVLNGEQLWTLIEGLEANDLLVYTHLLTGYIGSVSFLETILRVVEKLRSVNPDMIYVCDPVLGDDGEFYVPSELVSVYREKVIPVASMLTPNQFEAEKLTGFSISSEAEALSACNALHYAGPPKVVITSMELEGMLFLVGSHEKIKVQVLRNFSGFPLCNLKQEGFKVKQFQFLCCSGLQFYCKKNFRNLFLANWGQPPEQFKVIMPKIPAYFTGTGDLMTALLLGWSKKYPDELWKAAELAVASLQAVLHRTIRDYKAADIKPCIEQLEIRLIQSQDDIKSPQLTYFAEKY